MASLRVAAAGVAACAVALAALLVPGMHRHATPTAASGQPTLRTLAAQPLAFEPNAGRFGRRADYVAREHGMTLSIGRGGARLRLGDSREGLTTRLIRARRSPAVGRGRLPGTVNWYAGPRSQWRTGLPTFAQVRYANVYPGTDLVYHGSRRELEYDFVVGPHSDPARIAWSVTGARTLRLSSRGDLLAGLGNGLTVTQHSPVAYQWTASGRRVIDTRFVVNGRSVRFAVGAYDRTRPLVIDPVITYSDYYGTANSDSAQDVAIDPSHNIIIGGTSNGIGMIGKLSPDGSRQWMTFMGWGVNGVGTDPSGNVYIAGYTNGASFTPTGGAAQTGFGGGANDAFVARLTPDGAVSWGTYLGGGGSDVANGIAVDGSGDAYVVGYTYSATTTNFYTPGTFQTSINSTPDGFLEKYSPSGSRIYGTYMGGPYGDSAHAVAIPRDCQSNCIAFVGGYGTTGPTGGFPTTGGTDRPSKANQTQDGFLMRVNATGGRDWATFVPHTEPSTGGTLGSATVYGVAVSPAGNPTAVGSLGLPNNGGGQAFVGTYIAASGMRGPEPGDNEYASSNSGTAQDIAYDAQGNAYVVGDTTSMTLTTVFPVQQNYGGGTQDAFAMKLMTSRASSLPLWLTYLGGAQSEYGYGVATDPDGGVYFVGGTGSNDYPTVNAKQPNSQGSDGFITRIDVKPVTISSGPTGTNKTRDAAFTYSSGEPGGTFRCRLNPAESDFSACANGGKTYSGLADGDYTFEVQAVDQGGTPSRSATQAFTVDTKPVASFTIAPNPVLAGRGATFDASASSGGDSAITKFEWDLDGNGSFERDTGTISKTGEAFPKAGVIPIGLRITTAAGLTTTTTQNLTVSAATGPAQFGVTINNGAQYTRTPNVTVTSNFPASATDLLFSNDGGFLAPESFPAAKTLKWKLDSSGPERLPKIVYVRFLNGPIVSETHTDDIILDETPPKVEQAQVAPAGAVASSSGAVASAVRLESWKVKVKAKDSNSGVSKLQITANKRKPGKAVKYKTRLKVKSAKRPRWIRARDRAGNWSKWKRAR